MNKPKPQYTEQQIENEIAKIRSNNQSVAQPSITWQQAKEMVLNEYPKASVIPFAGGKIFRLHDFSKDKTLASAENEEDVWLYALAFNLNNTTATQIKASEKRLFDAAKAEQRQKAKDKREKIAAKNLATKQEKYFQDSLEKMALCLAKFGLITDELAKEIESKVWSDETFCKTIADVVESPHGIAHKDKTNSVESVIESLLDLSAKEMPILDSCIEDSAYMASIQELTQVQVDTESNSHLTNSNIQSLLDDYIRLNGIFALENILEQTFKK